jgi:hypothetical protein
MERPYEKNPAIKTATETATETVLKTLQESVEVIWSFLGKIP